MKRTLLITIIAITSFAACKEKPKSSYDKLVEEFRNDSIKRIAKETVEKDIAELLSDTSGIHLAPVQVTKARFVEKEYSNYKDIQLTYKNVSGKDIDAIRFKWTGTNAFGEPADVGSVYGDVGGGYTDDRLRAGRTTSGTWSILSRDGKKVTKAWAYEVVFSDGTKWVFKPSK